jgi:hypothetical protein
LRKQLHEVGFWEIQRAEHELSVLPPGQTNLYPTAGLEPNPLDARFVAVLRRQLGFGNHTAILGLPELGHPLPHPDAPHYTRPVHSDFGGQADRHATAGEAYADTNDPVAARLGVRARNKVLKPNPKELAGCAITQFHVTHHVK